MNETAKLHFNEGVRYSLQSDEQASKLNFRRSMDLAGIAVKEFGIALTADSNNQVILQAKGYALRQKGDLPESADIFEALIESKPDQVENYYQLSLCCFENSMVETGIQTFNEAIEISKDSQLIQRLCFDLGTIGLKFMFFAHDCLQMNNIKAFREIANSALIMINGGLSFESRNARLIHVRKLIVDDIENVKDQ